ncbi:MAG: hypothetical protein PVJ33_17275 [Lysobacterales bacterium]
MKKALFQYLLACYLIFVVTLLGLTGMGFLVAGLYMVLDNYLAAWAAAVVTGVVMLVLLLVVLLIAMFVARSGKRGSAAGRTTEKHDEIAALVLELFEKSDIDARDVSLAALVAGIILGASPELRRRLFGGGSKAE